MAETMLKLVAYMVINHGIANQVNKFVIKLMQFLERGTNTPAKPPIAC
jgi:hypothetical protein